MSYPLAWPSRWLIQLAPCRPHDLLVARQTSSPDRLILKGNGIFARRCLRRASVRGFRAACLGVFTMLSDERKLRSILCHAIAAALGVPVADILAWRLSLKMLVEIAEEECRA